MAIWVTPKLSSLPDVGISSPQDGHVLTYDSGTGEWVNEALPAGVTDHGALTGLADDDHTQYLLKAGGTMTGALAVSVEDAATNAVTTIGTLRHNSTGTPAAGFGAGLLFQLESSTTASQDAAVISASWEDATHATRKSKISISPVINGSLTEVVIIRAGSSPFGVLSVSEASTDPASAFTAARFSNTVNHLASTISQNSYAMMNVMTKNGAARGAATLAALYNQVLVQGAGQQDVVRGGWNLITRTSAAAIPAAQGMYSSANFGSGAGTIGYFAGFYADNCVGSNVTTQYGLYVNSLTTAATNYAIYTGAGAVRFGDALTVIQDSDTGAKPVVTLQQDDVSEDIFEITSTAGEGNAIEAVGAKTLTTTEFIKVTINGNTRYIPAGTIA